MRDPAGERTIPRLVEAAAERFGAARALEDGDVVLGFDPQGEDRGEGGSSQRTHRHPSRDFANLHLAQRRNVSTIPNETRMNCSHLVTFILSTT